MLWFPVFLLVCCFKFVGGCCGTPRRVVGYLAAVWFVETRLEHVFEIVNDHNLNDSETTANVKENSLTGLLGYLLWHYWHIGECSQSCCASQCTLMNSLVLPLMNHVVAVQLLYCPSCYLWIILSLSPLSRQLRKITWCIHTEDQ